MSTKRHELLALLIHLSLAFCGSFARSQESSPASELFQQHVAPLLRRECLACHNDLERKGELSLQHPDDLRARGLIDAAEPEKSDVLAAITSTDEEPAAMPKDRPPISVEQVAFVRKWLAEGAPWPEGMVLEEPVLDDRGSWSLRPLSPAPVPPGASHPVDAFIEARLATLQLALAPEADRRTLIRRLTYDLTGLPPTFEETEAFVEDDGPNAFERLVDRLLESPRYGERWARHWLDVVHYGETHGYDKDQPRPNAWPYRDYVIRAFNEDKPYGRFIEEQLAGDVLYPDTRDGIEALGFLAAGPWDLIGHAEVPESKIDGRIARHLDRDDMVATTINTFCSTTVHCAQCHHHKFDPIPQEDYYRLQAVFAALDRADRKYDLDPDTAIARRRLRDREYECRQRQRVVSANPSLAADEELTQLASELHDLARELRRLPAESLVYAGTVHQGAGNFLGTGGSGGRPRPIRILPRGDVTRPVGGMVAPGALSCVAGLSSVFPFDEEDPEGERRAALAHWISDPGNPLTWRSIVNRVWLYHFGRGLVETPNDFGRMGQPPSHPELLDWLACAFRDDLGGSLKGLHRLLVTSATYRQRSDIRNAIGEEIDAESIYLWRMTRRKLEAEEVRDSVLLVAGKLDLSMGGPGYQDFVIAHPEHSPHYEYDQADWENPTLHRRSIYRWIVRSQQQPWMAALDCADPSLLVDRRNQSLSPLQALAQRNNPMILVMAGHFARRVEQASPDALDKQVRQAFRWAIQRDPTAREQQVLSDFARRHGMVNTCRWIMNLNEFVFVD